MANQHVSQASAKTSVLSCDPMSIYGDRIGNASLKTTNLAVVRMTCCLLPVLDKGDIR